ncbi:MAG TPA: hypothetical protein VEY14_07100 [Nocardioidaceae bacterium]|jgi:TolA-binding protein|nr:hypothetical protein [Nocardioidaceae bacterium]
MAAKDAADRTQQELDSVTRRVAELEGDVQQQSEMLADSKKQLEQATARRDYLAGHPDLADGETSVVEALTYAATTDESGNPEK